MTQFNDVAAQWKELRNTEHKIIRLLNEGPFISGQYVHQFERNFRDFCGASFAVGVSSGTDAIKLAVQVLKAEKDTKVIIPANAHISSPLVASYFKLETVLIDCDKDHNMDLGKLELYLKTCEKPAIIIVTHMYGKPVDMNKLCIIAKGNYVIEDCSHAHGAKINGQHVGTFGDIGCFSLYPTKNLGACGDAGIIISKNHLFEDPLRALINYGAYGRHDCQEMGWNNRLDEIQALILDDKLPLLTEWNKRKENIALLYNGGLHDVGDLILPATSKDRVYHIFQIRTTQRDMLQKFLKGRSIPTLVHYPIPVHKTSMFEHLSTSEEMRRTEAYSNEVLSLPIHPFMTDNEVESIVRAIRCFFEYTCPCGSHTGMTDNYIWCKWCTRSAQGETTNIISPTGRYRQI